MWGGQLCLSVIQKPAEALANMFGETVCSTSSERKHIIEKTPTHNCKASFGKMRLKAAG